MHVIQEVTTGVLESNLANYLKGSMEERSKSIFDVFELLPLSCIGGAKLYYYQNVLQRVILNIYTWDILRV